MLFAGDSLIHFNQNRIGVEYYRMLATTDNTTTYDGDAILQPTLGLCNGKIEFVGESGSNINNRYQIANSLNIMMTGNRPNTTSPTNTAQNPFYNPNSNQPNELDADGFNKRVDFKWYFEKICGIGQYPNLIYLTTGVNDIYYGGWTFDLIEPTVERLHKVLSRMKAACDEIAGGESNVVIKLMNHQFYPLRSGSNIFNFDVVKQRRLWLDLYNGYYDLITNPSNQLTFAELIDCASKFDWEYGYSTQTLPVNNRNRLTEKTVLEPVHISVNGALQYADCLINDFLCDERFD